ncbi:MAG: ice-binding family protein [bacterium]|nr:ice-binding family protein [bacterium]
MKIFNKASVVTVAVSLALSLCGPMVALAAGGGTVNLGTAGTFAILAKTGVSTTGTTSVVGDIGVSPAASTYLTGFGLTLSSASASSTSALVTGKVYAPGYANPTPANLTTAVSDMETAYTDAMGRAPTVTELGAGNIGGLTLAPGVYKWGTGLSIPTDVTLSGGANDVWIFQIAQNLNVSSGTKVLLAGGAQPGNIFWVVAGQTTIGTTAVVNGTILDQTAIVLNTGATLNGRALAQSAVTLDASTVRIGTASVSATPATPATPAVPATPSVNPATPAVPATPASPAYTYTSTTVTNPTPSRGQAIRLGSGQMVYVNSNGVFTDADGGPMSHNSVSQSAKVMPISSTPSGSAFGQSVRAIATNLGSGSRDNNVAILQEFLISQNKGPAAKALGKVGASAYFGGLTKAALAEFQASVGIKPALGNFGAITRSFLQANY